MQYILQNWKNCAKLSYDKTVWDFGEKWRYEIAQYNAIADCVQTMRDIPLSLLNSIPLGFDITKRYKVPGVNEWHKLNKYQDMRVWITTPEGREMVEWVRDNLSQYADLVLLFEREWLITSSNKEDQVLLALKFGMQ